MIAGDNVSKMCGQSRKQYPMKQSFLLILMLCSLTAAREPQSIDQDHGNAIRERYGLPALTQAEYDAEQFRQAKMHAEFEQQRLSSAGFVPASEIARQGRSQIRVTFSEPRLFLRMPGVTIERVRNSRINLTLSSDGRAKTGHSVVSGERWKALAKLEDAAFAADPPQIRSTWRKGDLIAEPPPVCHGWGATLERITPTRTESVWGWECNRSDPSPARLAYAVELAKISLSAFPQCSAIENAIDDPLSALGECFGKFEPSTTENP